MVQSKYIKPYFITRLKEIWTIISAITLCCVVLIFQNPCSYGVLKGIYFCVNTLIPSLFPFMVISSFIATSGISQIIGKMFSKLTKFLFYLPGSAGCAVILGFIGGYPTGAKTVQSLLSKNLINEEQANRIMKFVVGAGPAFIISTVGAMMLKNQTVGVIIFISQILVSAFIGIVLGIAARLKKVPFYENQICDLEPPKLSVCFIKACGDATNTTLLMCGPIIIFAALIAILESGEVTKCIAGMFSCFWLPNELAQKLICIFLEVNSGCLASINSCYAPIFMSFAIGWGGLCVHFQIMSVFASENRIKFSGFTLFRAIQACLSSGVTYLVLSVFDLITMTMSIPHHSKNVYIPTVSTSVHGGFALIFLCIYFLYDISHFTSKRISDEG